MMNNTIKLLMEVSNVKIPRKNVGHQFSTLVAEHFLYGHKDYEVL